MPEEKGASYEEWSTFLADLHAELEDGEGTPGARADVAADPSADGVGNGAGLRWRAQTGRGAAAIRAVALLVAVVAPATLGPADRLAPGEPSAAAPRQDADPEALRAPEPPSPPHAPAEAGLARAEDGRVERVVDRLETRSVRLGDLDHRRLARVLVLEADLARIDPLLVLALIQVESSYDAAARSDRGALGLMQLREPTLLKEAERAGVDRADPFDPETNVRMGIRYLRRLLDVFGREELALMAYNAGPNRILGYLRADGIPERFREYPRKIKAERRRLRRAYPELRAPTRLAVR